MAKIKFRCFNEDTMNVSFCGLKENINYGHQAIAQVKKDFPDGFKSNTYYEMFSDKKDPDILSAYNKGILKSREQVKWQMRHGIMERDATEVVVRESGYANCGEQAFLVSNRLNKMGVKNKIVNMAICSAKTKMVENGHTFCVIDTDNFINPMSPKSWSDEAVVVDMWSNTVAKGSDAIKYFYNLFKPDSEKQVVYITSVFE